MRSLEYCKVILKYRLEHLIPKQAFRDLTLVRKIFNIEPVTGPLPFRIRKALEELGPVFIKLGQILSVRQDLFGTTITSELKNLQDNVAPLDFKLFKKQIESIPLEFLNIDSTPLAVGSIAQVYSATLKTGEQVVIKIIKPNIVDTIEKDFQFLKRSSSLLSLYRPFRKIKIPLVIEQLYSTIKSEVNLTNESNNIEKFASQMQQFSFIKTPKVYFRSEDVLVLERMYGTPIDQKEDLINQGIDLKQVLTNGTEAFIVQAFYYGFYHADPHPGNLWIDRDGNRIYLDFGIMGSITKEDRTLLIKLMIALHLKKYSDIKKLIIDAKWAHGNLDDVDKDFEEIFLNFNNKQIKDISLLNNLNKVLEILVKYDVEVPHQFTLLVKTLITLDGFTKSLGADYNLVKSIIPVINKHFLKFSR